MTEDDRLHVVADLLQDLVNSGFTVLLVTNLRDEDQLRVLASSVAKFIGLVKARVLHQRCCYLD